MLTQQRRAAMMEYLFAARAGLWLCALPVRVRLHSLPSLLCATAGRRAANDTADRAPAGMDVDRMASIVSRVCGLGLFDMAFFPRRCVRQSLVLFHELYRKGYPAVIHFGVSREGAALSGHSWVTVNGRPVGERIPLKPFAPIWAFPKNEERG